ncbi:MAG: DUF177 domain-containing protein [bacterium]|nr:DUF177 domain-containing protein [bacterium]
MAKVILINEIRGDSSTFDEEVELRSEPGADAPVSMERARIEGAIVRETGKWILAAKVAGDVRLDCSRCAEPYDWQLESPIRLEIRSSGPDTREGESELREDEIWHYHAREGKVDLAEVARERVLLDLPLKPLCRDDCRGLCPTCGGNRNLIECDCRSEAVDPRLAPLMEIRKQIDES